jgi:transcriptional regulator with XRE-family HTH domain
MPAGQRPLIRRRLRIELRRERERAGKSQAEVAKKMEWSPSKIIRVEAGQVGISTNDLKALLDFYNVTDTERRATMLDLGRAARQQNAWWTTYRDVVPSPDYADFLGYENDMTHLMSYTPMIVPGLLQTEEYARELFVSGGPSDRDEELVERLVQLRMARKQHVMDRDDQPEITTVLDEAVLHRVVGGAEVMNDQLTSIADLAALDNVTVLVVPFSAGAHPGMVGAFQILDFSDPGDAPVLQFDAAPRNVVLRDDPEGLDLYQRIFQRIRGYALSEDESISLINKVAGEMLGEETDYEE